MFEDMSSIPSSFDAGKMGARGEYNGVMERAQFKKLIPLVVIAFVVIGFVAVRLEPQLSAVHMSTQASSTTPDAQAAQTHDEEYWKVFVKPDVATLKVKLSPLQFNVTQEDGTETPFHNEYWDNEEVGLYVDIVSGEPLFSSTDKLV
jgi:hypothetical protein